VPPQTSSTGAASAGDAITLTSSVASEVACEASLWGPGGFGETHFVDGAAGPSGSTGAWTPVGTGASGSAGEGTLEELMSGGWDGAYPLFDSELRL